MPKDDERIKPGDEARAVEAATDIILEHQRQKVNSPVIPFIDDDPAENKLPQDVDLASLDRSDRPDKHRHVKELLDRYGREGIVKYLEEIGMTHDSAESIVNETEPEFNKPGGEITVTDYFLMKAERLSAKIDQYQNDAIHASSSHVRRQAAMNTESTFGQLGKIETLGRIWNEGEDIEMVRSYFQERISYVDKTISKSFKQIGNPSLETSVRAFTASAVDYLMLRRLNREVEARA